jgi:hypothetical protein
LKALIQSLEAQLATLSGKANSSSAASGQGSNGIYSANGTTTSGTQSASGNTATAGTTASAAGASASQNSSANEISQIESELETAQSELVQLMLANGQTTGLVSTTA